MTQIDGAGQQDTNDQNAEALQAALAQREVTLEAQPQGGSDVPSHQNSDPVIRRIGNSTPPSGSYRKTSCTVAYVPKDRRKHGCSGLKYSCGLLPVVPQIRGTRRDHERQSDAIGIATLV